MRFIYPSYTAQSDDPMVTGLAASLTSGMTNDADKIKAIHDYIIKNTVYDQISADLDGMRKKQDALTVLGARYTYDTRYPNGHFLAVCEGYANTFAALARAAGIETKFISSQSMAHGWNNVNVNGVWKFIDVTWDDPTREDSSPTNVVDHGPDFVRYNYYLLDTMNGVNNSHTGGVAENGRQIGNSLPWQRGVPDGWY
jgi:transglutaminase/protease-like cytokinesis protein 3